MKTTARTTARRTADRRRRGALRDEFGLVRGRPFLTGTPAPVADTDVDEYGHRLTRRSDLAFACA